MSQRTENAESFLLGQKTGDIEVVLKAFADDANYWGIEKKDGDVHRKLYEGKDAIRAYIGAWLKTATKGIEYKVDEARELADGVLVYWSDEATGDGEQYHNSGVLVVEFHDDGSIKYVGAYNDSWDALRNWSFLED
jgi:ketosteroid isomerase-like protein